MKKCKYCKNKALIKRGEETICANAKCFCKLYFEEKNYVKKAKNLT